MIRALARTSSGGGSWDAGEMLPLLKRHEIQILLAAGFSPTEVAGRAGVSLDTVRRVKKEDIVPQVDDRARRRERGIGRPPKAAAFGEKVRAWLEAVVSWNMRHLVRLRTPEVRTRRLVAAVNPALG